MMLTIDEIAERYRITRASVIIRMAAVSDFGGRYDENINIVKRIMEPGCPLGVDKPEEDTDEFYRWVHDEVGF